MAAMKLVLQCHSCCAVEVTSESSPFDEYLNFHSWEGHVHVHIHTKRTVMILDCSTMPYSSRNMQSIH